MSWVSGKKPGAYQRVWIDVGVTQFLTRAAGNRDSLSGGETV